MRRILIVMMSLVVLCLETVAQPGTAASQWNVDSKDHLALDGYDPVAYFTAGKAVKGRASVIADHEGIRYRFESEHNKKLFLESPSAYKPQYGGWCAYAMGAKGEKVEVDPETFKILDGRLYLFYNKFFNNTLDSWNKNEPELRRDADKNWSKFATN